MPSNEGDQSECASPAAVISYSFWPDEFAGDPGVTNRNVRLDGRLFPVIGVTAPGFFGVDVGHQFGIAVPVCSDPIFWEPGKAALGTPRSYSLARWILPSAVISRTA
jgi:hypothetical protein